MRSISVLIAMLGAFTLYCIVMILKISSGQISADQTFLDFLPNSYKIKFIISQNTTELMMALSGVLLVCVAVLVVYFLNKRNRNAEISRREKEAHRQMSKYQSNFQQRLSDTSNKKK
jgi:Ca2+/Na+ antiporter